MTTQLVTVAVFMNDLGEVMMIPDKNNQDHGDADTAEEVSSGAVITCFPSISVDATETHRHALDRLLIDDFGVVPQETPIILDGGDVSMPPLVHGVDREARVFVVRRWIAHEAVGDGGKQDGSSWVKLSSGMFCRPGQSFTCEIVDRLIRASVRHFARGDAI